jgi:hypothetical protein
MNRNDLFYNKTIGLIKIKLPNLVYDESECVNNGFHLFNRN